MSQSRTGVNPFSNMATEKPESVGFFKKSISTIFARLMKGELLCIWHSLTAFVSSYDIWQRCIFKMAVIQTGSTRISGFETDRNEIPNAKYMFSKNMVSECLISMVCCMRMQQE
jgi:hypothetical protein